MGISKSVGGSIKNSKRSIILYLNLKQPLNSRDVSYPCKLIQKSDLQKLDLAKKDKSPACRFDWIEVHSKGASCMPSQGSQKQILLPLQTCTQLSTSQAKRASCWGRQNNKGDSYVPAFGTTIARSCFITVPKVVLSN